jgi:hypothetical protein
MDTYMDTEKRKVDKVGLSVLIVPFAGKIYLSFFPPQSTEH